MKYWKIIAAVVVSAALGWWLYANRGSIDKDSIIRYGQSVPAAGLVAAFLFLPLIGFPISILLVLCGLRFGVGWGMAVTTVCMFFHHFVAYRICQGRLGDRIRGFAERKGYQLPKMEGGNAVWGTVLFASLHGPPYALKLYLLALTHIPFRIYCWIGGTVYILFSIIPVGAAAAAVHVDVTWIYVAIIAISAIALLAKYLRSRAEKRNEPSSGG